MSQYGSNVSVTVIARKSCPGICDHQAQCGFPPLKTATDHKPLHFIYYYNLVLLKNVRNQMRNEQRNYCFQSFPASLVTLCEVKGCNLVKDKKGNKQQWKLVSMQFLKILYRTLQQKSCDHKTKQKWGSYRHLQICSKDKFTDNRESSQSKLLLFSFL